MINQKNISNIKPLHPNKNSKSWFHQKITLKLELLSQPYKNKNIFKISIPFDLSPLSSAVQNIIFFINPIKLKIF